MGCFGWIFRRRRDVEGENEFGPRPAHDSITSGNSGFTEIEKAYIKDRNPAAGPVSNLPPSAANLRPAAHPQFSAYSGVAVRDDTSHIYAPRYRGGGSSSYQPDDSRDWTGSQVSTQVSRQSDTYLTKLKDEGGVDDPEELARRKKRDEIQRKAAEEEQERLDFFQMM